MIENGSNFRCGCRRQGYLLQRSCQRLILWRHYRPILRHRSANEDRFWAPYNRLAFYWWHNRSGCWPYNYYTMDYNYWDRQQEKCKKCFVHYWRLLQQLVRRYILFYLLLHPSLITEVPWSFSKYLQIFSMHSYLRLV